MTTVIAPSRRGACPTLDTPMLTGDGLLARLRISGNRLSPEHLTLLANLALVHGNGLVEVSARGNLQVRGLSPSSAPLFEDAVSAIFDLETGLVIDISPLSGEDPMEKADSRPLAEAIRTGAMAMHGKLGPKVSVVVDSAGQISLASLKADIRLVALDAAHWAVHFGDGKPQVMDAEGAISATLAMLGALAAFGADARATDLFPVTNASPISTHHGAIPPLSKRPEEGGVTMQLTSGHTTAIALPFGQMHGEALIVLADGARTAGLGNIRLAPGNRLLFDGASPSLVAQAAALGFIVASDDARLRISACIGSDGCASGNIAARRLAELLASHVQPGTHLHVSGCAKGCAHPRATDVTLVGRADGIGLVINGRAGDTPSEILDEAGLIPAVAARQEAR
ncbi:precorrin-3B synthase [Devosia faecipullorum]|uniref:precorrin-3B synthase n=1 Tax=Devosia faecipullorum TaxID=2755039 RepID=UPI00187B2AC1|nr:precorrin-3B synthase [Devosia faecipullorum]MBE7733731.1 precorrin-3B synthase [Devosia faecipullorum]